MMESFLCGLFCDDGGWANSSLAALFLQGQETYPRQRDGRAAAIRPFAGAGNHQAGGKGVPRHYNMSGSKEHFRWFKALRRQGIYHIRQTAEPCY